MVQTSVSLSIYWENNQVGKHQDILCFQYCYKRLSSHFSKLMNPIKLILNNKFEVQGVSFSKEWTISYVFIAYSNNWRWATIEGDILLF